MDRFDLLLSLDVRLVHVPGLTEGAIWLPLQRILIVDTDLTPDLVDFAYEAVASGLTPKQDAQTVLVAHP